MTLSKGEAIKANIFSDCTDEDKVKKVLNDLVCHALRVDPLQRVEEPKEEEASDPPKTSSPVAPRPCILDVDEPMSSRDLGFIDVHMMRDKYKHQEMTEWLVI